MAKTTGQDRETRFGTLSNVVDQLKQTNQLLAQQGNAITRFMEQTSRESKVEGKKDVENKRENKRGSRILGAARGGIKGLAALTGIPALAGGLSMAISPITSGLGFLLKPIGLIAKLVMKGGPIALVIGGLYALFNDIAENENFKATIDKIKTLWNDNIIPAFKSIKETVTTLAGNADIKATFEKISNWFSNFKTQIQDWVLGNLEIITTTIAGVLEGVDSLLKGDWKEGISKIGSTLFNGIKNFFDNAMTNILEMFGIDFGEGGTFLGKAEEIIDSLLLNMIAKWNDFKQGIKDTWASMVNFFTGDSGYVMTTINNIKQWITDKWNSFKDTVKQTWDGMVADVKQAFIDAVDIIIVKQVQKIKDLKDGMISKWGDIKDSIMEAMQKVAIWFMFKPKELGLLLEQKWVETKGKFMEKLASFAGTIAGLPAQLRLALLESVKGSFLGDYLVDDETIANARADVAAGTEFTKRLTQEARSNTQNELDRIRKDRIALQMEKMNMERAATTVIQQNTGGATVNTTNISQAGGQVGDPYASSYMGRALPGAF